MTLHWRPLNKLPLSQIRVQYLTKSKWLELLKSFWTSTAYCVWCPWHPAQMLTCMSSVIPSWKGNENLLPLRDKLILLLPKLLLISCIFLQSAAHYHTHIWDRKLVFDVSATLDFRQCKPHFEDSGCKYISVLYITIRMCLQNLELREMESATKFCNLIHRSSWEYRYSCDRRGYLPLYKQGFLTTK